MEACHSARAADGALPGEPGPRGAHRGPKGPSGRSREGSTGAHGRGMGAGDRMAGRRPRPGTDRSSAKRDDAEFLLGLGTGYRTSLPARLTARPPRPCCTVPAPRCSSLSSPSIALPAASCPRVTPRDGHAGVTEGLACIRRSRRRDSSPCVVCFLFSFFKHLDRWVEFALCGRPESRAFSISLKRVLAGNRCPSGCGTTHKGSVCIVGGAEMPPGTVH